MAKLTFARLCTSFFTLALGLSLVSSVSAQAPATVDASSDRGHFQLTPYVWMTGLDGHIRPFRGAPTAHVDRSFSDVLSSLDAAAFLTGTARKGRYVLQGDLSHASVSETASLPLGQKADTKLRQTSLTLTGGYNWQVAPLSSVDLMAGVRLWDIKASVQIPGLLAAQSNTSFADPVVAVRWRYDFAPNWSALIYGDLGGFGVGSDATWQVMGSVNYQMKDNIYLSLGYRHLKVDYQDNGKKLDFSLGGPIIGVTFRF